MLNIVSKSLNDTEKIGRNLSKRLNGKETIALFGNLGAGKTTFVKSLVKNLGVEDEVTSPTFSIVNEYDGEYKIYHFDMYRINNYQDLVSVGFYDYLENGIVIIEWSENIKDFLPEDAIKISISHTGDENSRLFKFEGIDRL